MAAVFSTSGERFQSTPPCGGDGSDLINFQTKSLFQSTPPCGGDPPEPGELEHSLISIHAPLRGRLPIFLDNAESVVFQSTPPCGGDKRATRAGSSWHNFNPRPLAGATVWSISWPFRHLHFNPRPLAGATPPRYLVLLEMIISIHAPLRGRLGRMPTWLRYD